MEWAIHKITTPAQLVTELAAYTPAAGSVVAGSAKDLLAAVAAALPAGVTVLVNVSAAENITAAAGAEVFRLNLSVQALKPA